MKTTALWACGSFMALIALVSRVTATDQPCDSSTFGGIIAAGHYTGTSPNSCGDAIDDMDAKMGLTKPTCGPCDDPTKCQPGNDIPNPGCITWTICHWDPVRQLYVISANVQSATSWVKTCTECPVVP
jgi:hypothetical protein